MKRLLIAGLLAAVPMSAQAYSLSVRNDASQPVAGLNLFPLDEDGTPIEDNLGGFIDPLAPGKTQRVAIGAECGPTLAVVIMADETELRLNFDSCKQVGLRVGD